MRFPGTTALTAILIVTCSLGRVYAQACPVPQTQPDAERWSGQAMWETLAGMGYQIDEITIVVNDVFAPNDSDYDRWYANVANAIHIKTRANAIRSLLLFKHGDPVEAQVIYQTLRRLRAQTYLRAASITPTVCYDNHLVAVTVQVHDSWTLKIGAQYKHVGGSSIYSLHLEESNLLGFGKELEISQTSDPQRHGTLLHYRDQALAGSRWQMFYEYQSLSDGYSKTFNIGRPFYEDSDPWATQFHFLDANTNLNFYNQTRHAWQVSDQVREFQWRGTRLLSFENNIDYRLGLSFDNSRYTYGPLQSIESGLLPAPELNPRTLSGIALTGQLFQDHFASYENIANIDRVEDYNLGWDIGASLGYNATALGSTQAGWYGGLNVSYGMQLPYTSLMLFSTSASGRREGGEVRDFQANVTADIYNKSLPYQTLVAHVRLDERFNPDPEHFLYLGGLDGLRGYPNFLLIGDRRWTVFLADRLQTPWKIGTLFKIGFVGYFEAGRIHQLSPPAWSRVYSDVGFGLRIGNLKSAHEQVIFMTIAKPLVHGPGIPSYQIVVGGGGTF